MKIYLVRHAQSNPCHSLSDPDWPLSELGQSQSVALTPILKELQIAEIYSSPYVRCVSTIKPFVQETGIPIKYLDDLRERKVVEGIVDDFEEIWERSWSDPEFTMPNCESSRTAQSRMCRALDEICVTATSDVIGVSSHGNVIALLINALDPSFGITEATAMRNPDILLLQYSNGKLVWDKGFESPMSLGKISSHHNDTPFPR